MPKRSRTAGAPGSGESEIDKEKDTIAEEEIERIRDNQDATMTVKRGRAATRGDDNDNEIDKDEEDSEGSSAYSDEEGGPPSQNFVAWLEEGATSLSVGELHFSNAEHTGSQDAPNTYCVVYELKLQSSQQQPGATDEEEDEESPLLFQFDGGFPFKILPASACVGIPLEPVVVMPLANRKKTATSADDDDDDDGTEEIICTEYFLEADIHRALLEELLGSISDDAQCVLYTKVSPQWNLPKLATEKATIDGLNAWWKAGETKTGWDLGKIPKCDYTTAETLRGSSGNNSKNSNILLDLYRDLCAFRPLTSADDRDCIEERFEWRTCLCTYFAWAVPNEQALEVLHNLKQPILEIGAGTGYWAWLLSNHVSKDGDNKRPIDIVAYDAIDSHDGHKHRFRHGLVRDGGVEQASSKDHEGRALMLCWPDIVGDSASDDADRGTFGFDTLRGYTGDTVVYVGELGPGVVRAATGWGDPFPPGGSSASAAFQDELAARFELTERVELPNWPPYNSHLMVWKRKPQHN